MKNRTDNTKQQLIEQAGRLIQLKGFQATSVNDIITATGVTKGGFYHHFLNKDELGLEVMKQAKEEFMIFLDQILLEATPRKSLSNFLDAVLAKHRQADFIGGCIFGNTALEMADNDPRYTLAITAVFDEWLGKLEKIILAAQQKQQINVNTNAAALANLMVTTIEGGIMLSRLTKSQTPLQTCLASLKTAIFEKAS